MTDRKKPGVAFWATVVVVVALVAYPLSFGPACWITSRLNFGTRSISVIYRPIARAAFGDPSTDEEIPSETLHWVFRWYAELAARPDWGWWTRVYDGPAGEVLNGPWEWASALGGGVGSGISGATVGVDAPSSGAPIPEPHALENTVGPDPPAPAIAPPSE